MARYPSPDSDSLFQPINEDVFYATQRDENLDDSDETRFSPDPTKEAGEIQRLQSEDEVPDGDDSDAGVDGLLPHENDVGGVQAMSMGSSGSQQLALDRVYDDGVKDMDGQVGEDVVDLDETMFEGADDLPFRENVRIAPAPSYQADTATLFSHDLDLEWSQCMDFEGPSSWAKASPLIEVVCHNESKGEAHPKKEVENGDDLYIQFEDPVTQEMRVYKVSSKDEETMLSRTHQECHDAGGIDPANQIMGVFTEDFLWTQNEDAYLIATSNSHGPGRVGAGGDHMTRAALTVAQDRDGGSWTQTREQRQDTSSSEEQQVPEAASDEGCALDTSMPLFTEDFVWTQAPLERDEGEGADSATQPLTLTPTPQVVPSMDAAADAELLEGMPLPCSLPWQPSILGDQLQIEEIVASLRSMSFNLVTEDADAILSTFGEALPDEKPSVAVAAEGSPRPLTPSAVTLPPSPTERTSPTFVTASCRRRRIRHRLHKAMPVEPVPGPSTSWTPSPAACRPSAGGKRKLSSQTQGRGRRVQGQGLTRPEASVLVGAQGQGAALGSSPQLSPCSQPRKKVKRSNHHSLSAPAARRSINKGKTEATVIYSRLQELRFNMQDILAGRKLFPKLDEVLQMQRDVQGIIESLSLTTDDRNRSGRPKLKREQAKQAADKLLHQLHVLTENSECFASIQENPQSIAPPYHWSSDTENYSAPAVNGQGEIDSSSQNQKSTINSSPPKCSPVITKQAKPRGRKKKSLISGNECVVRIEDNCYGHTDNLWRKVVSNEVGVGLQEDESQVFSMKKDEEKNNTETNLSKFSIIPDEGYDNGIPEKETVHTDVALEPELESKSKDGTEAVSRMSKSFSEMQCVVKDDSEKQSEYEHLVNLIRERTAKASILKKQEESQKESESYEWKGGPLKLTGVLLHKMSEYEPIDAATESFWGNSNAPIPQEWIESIEWID